MRSLGVTPPPIWIDHAEGFGFSRFGSYAVNDQVSWELALKCARQAVAELPIAVGDMPGNEIIGSEDRARDILNRDVVKRPPVFG